MLVSPALTGMTKVHIFIDKTNKIIADNGEYQSRKLLVNQLADIEKGT